MLSDLRIAVLVAELLTDESQQPAITPNQFMPMLFVDLVQFEFNSRRQNLSAIERPQWQEEEEAEIIYAAASSARPSVNRPPGSRLADLVAEALCDLLVLADPAADDRTVVMAWSPVAGAIGYRVHG